MSVGMVMGWDVIDIIWTTELIIVLFSFYPFGSNIIMIYTFDWSGYKKGRY